MATINRIGYGQVEPNHLSAQRTGQIYAQLPAASTITVLENGQFVKYDYKSNKVALTGDGEWMLVYNEVKLYDARDLTRDYAMKAADAIDGVIVPRVFKTNVGDIFTTNCLEAAGSYRGTVTGTETITEGTTILTPGSTGYLTTTGASNADMQFRVVKIYTMPDGQQGVKVQRIK